MVGTYKQNIDYIVNGEAVEAGVANRASRQLQDNIDFVKNQLDQTAGGVASILRSKVVRSDVVVGTPVFYNNVTSQFEPAQGISGQWDVVGVCYQKPYAANNLADICIAGQVALSISSVLDTGISFAAGRYFLSVSAPGKLTNVRPTGVQISVLVADGASNVYVSPQDRNLSGATGSQGPQGATGATGATGASGTGLTLSSPSNGNTTDSDVAIITLTSAKGILGTGTVKNLGGANSMVVREDVTDAFGTTSFVETTLAASGTRVLNPSSVLGSATPPYQAYQVSVRSLIVGTPTSYAARMVSATQ